MKHPLLLDCWDDIYRAGPATAGGKGWQLAKLARYGLPVPDTLVIPAETERVWLAGLKVPSLEALGSDTELYRFRQQLLAHPLPTTLIEALHDKLTSRGWQRRALAVRSSATAEDSPSASFAGIHQSCLNLVGPDALAEGIRTVWASRWTPRAIAYRKRLGFEQSPFAMAVVIMPLIAAQASGIAFTRDPLSGRDDRIIVQAHWGLGEALVAGEACGDEIVLGENPFDDTLDLLRITPGDKSVMRVPVTGGTRKQATPEGIAQTPVLDESQALQLGELLRDAAIALDFSRPAFDLEWVWDSERFWLVQARPITALKHNTYPALGEQPEIWSRGNTCEVTPYPLSVYDWFSSRRLINLMLEQPLVSSTYPVQPGIQRAGLFEGHLYLNLSIMQWELHDAFGLPPKTINALIGGQQPEIAVPRASLKQRFNRLRRLMGVMRHSKRAKKSAHEILRSAHETARQGREATLPLEEAAILSRLTEQVRQTRQMKSLFYLQTSSGGSLSFLADLIEHRLPGEGHTLTAALLAGGEPSVTARQSYELAKLAQIAREDPLAHAWIVEPSARDDWRTALPETNPFRIAFTKFLARYGHRGVYETYFRHPRWRESPDYLFDTIRGLMNRDLENLRQHQTASANQALATLRKRLPFWLLPIVNRLIRDAHAETNHREAARSALVALMEPQRRLLMQMSVNWRNRGLIDDADAIFELSLPELRQIIEGAVGAEGVCNRLSDRRTQLKRWHERDAKAVLLEQTGQPEPTFDENHAIAHEGAWIAGMAVGTGHARGRARILQSPEEGVRLEPGEVLVAPSTDPSWTPLFLKAGGLIMETGGYLSHGAIVAREFGIPAVVHLPGILKQLKTGDEVEVDGRMGRIRRVKGKP